MKSLKFFKPALATHAGNRPRVGLLSAVPGARRSWLHRNAAASRARCSSRPEAEPLTYTDSLSHRVPNNPEIAVGDDQFFGAGGAIVTGPTSPARTLTTSPWSVERGFRGRWLNGCQQWQRPHRRDIHGVNLGGRGHRLSHCSKGLSLLVLFLIEQRDLQRQDFCNPRRNTGHLRMDVGKRSEPELHASDSCTAGNWASDRHDQSRNLDRKLFSQTEWLGQSARIDYQRVFSIWNNEQLRTHYCPAKSHWKHFPRRQCAWSRLDCQYTLTISKS